MATFNVTVAPISRLYEAKQVVLIPNLSDTLQVFWSYSSVSTLEK